MASDTENSLLDALRKELDVAKAQIAVLGENQKILTQVLMEILAKQS